MRKERERPNRRFLNKIKKKKPKTGPEVSTNEERGGRLTGEKQKNGGEEKEIERRNKDR